MTSSTVKTHQTAVLTASILGRTSWATHPKKLPFRSRMRSILTVVALLISYGSLFPFNFEAVHDLSAAANNLISDRSLPTGRGDLFGNIVLFVPYGFISAMLAAQSQRPYTTRFALAMLGLLLAFALQVAQIWLPSRVAAAGDAIANAAGLFMGLGLGVWLTRYRLPTAPRIAPGMLVPALLVLLWVAYRWFPWVPTIELQNIKHAIRPLLLTPDFNIVRIIHTSVAWLVFFKMVGLLRHPAVSRTSLVVLALVITAGPLFLVNASISHNNLAGLVLALLALPLLSHPHALPGLCFALLGSLLLSGLHPFVLVTPHNGFLWVPFSGFLTGSMTNNFLVLLEKTYLYGALIFTMQKSGVSPLTATLISATWLSLIEAMQIMVLGRTAESTDALYALLIGYVMVKLARAQIAPAVVHQ